MDIKIEVAENSNSRKIDNYKIVIPLSGDINIEKKLSEKELKSFVEDIITVLGYKDVMETFNCTVKDAREIKETIDKATECRNCDLKMKECYRCCMVCESPLEQKLLKALSRNNIKTELQLRINKDSTVSHFPEPVDPHKILTLPDFYIETENNKICVYTDGHTYHERTEYQAVRDRSIDRELQNLGYVVLRYTTSDINQRLDDTVENIKKTMNI